MTQKMQLLSEVELEAVGGYSYRKRIFLLMDKVHKCLPAFLMIPGI